MSGVYCCKDCTKRYLGCHDKCEEYQRQSKEHKERKEKVAKEMGLNGPSKKAKVWYHTSSTFKGKCHRG